MLKPFITILALVVALYSRLAQAERVLEHYDLDSLAYLSDIIVRVEVGDSQQFKTVDGNCVVHAVKALDVFKGPLKAGASFRVAGLDVFHRAPGIANHADSWDPIKKGDVVYLFLVPNGKVGYAMYRLTNADWTVIESGARLLIDQRVYSFGQAFAFDKPGLRAPHGFVAMTDATFPGAAVDTRQAFEDRLKQSPQTIARINRLLAADASPETATQIIAVLRARSEQLRNEKAWTDVLGSRLAARLAQFADPADVASLLTDNIGATRWALEAGLQTQAGRSYLLNRVGDPKENGELRLRFARILSDAGWNYVREVGGLRSGKIKDLHPDFAASLARLAASNLGTDLCQPLLTGISGCAVGQFPPDDLLAADFEAAAKVLSQAFSKATLLDQFRIAETLMQVSPERYRQLLPDAGLLLTLTEPDGDFGDAFKRRKLHLRCRFRNQLAMETELKLILRPSNGKPDVEVPLDTGIGKLTNNFGSDWSITATIPDDAAGKFHVFLRDYKGNRPNGDGMGFEIEIPAI